MKSKSDFFRVDLNLKKIKESTSKKSRKIKSGRSYPEKFVLQTLDPKVVRPLEFYPSERNSKKDRKDFLLLFQFILGYLLEKLPFYPSFIKLIN